MVVSSFASSLNPITGKLTSRPVVVNVTIAVPKITYISTISAQTPSESGSISVTLNVTANDNAGTAYIANVTANFTSGATTRQNSSCLDAQNIDANNANFSCTIVLWWFDPSGTYNIGVALNDTAGNNATNTSTTFTYNQLSAFTLAPSALAWNVLTPGALNQTPTNTPVLLNNTGNKPITSGNIQINATNLRGETNPNVAIWANNFSVGTSTGSKVECGGTGSTNMNWTAYAAIAGATLPIGNYTVNDGVTGALKLYPCIKLVGSELTSQAYSTANESAWTIKII